MSLIVAARFQTFDEAQRAAADLFAKGYSEDDLNMFYVNTAGEHGRFPLGGDRAADADSGRAHWGAIIGAAVVGIIFAVILGGIGWSILDSALAVAALAGVGAWVGSLWGALWVTGRKNRKLSSDVQMDRGHPEVRQSGVLLALRVLPEKEAEARDILSAAGGRQIERAQGQWRDGKWQDFDPLKPPQPVTPAQTQTVR